MAIQFIFLGHFSNLLLLVYGTRVTFRVCGPLDIIKIDIVTSTYCMQKQSYFDVYFFQLYGKETKKKVKHAPANFNPPKGITGLPSDKLNLCWTLD